MFSGIIETIGHLSSIDRHGEDLTITIDTTVDGLQLGESIATNGVCLTVSKILDRGFSADVSIETLRRTTLGELGLGSVVNLERSLRVGDRISGHFVFGHVDCVGSLLRRDAEGSGQRLHFRVPSEFRSYLANKGSVAINGVSLTVCDPQETGFAVALIPHTAAATNLGSIPEGSRVNLEADMLARYVREALESMPRR